MTFNQDPMWENNCICLLTIIINFFFVYANRVIPVTIAIFRYILVCKAETAERFGKPKLARLLIVVIYLIPTIGVIAAVVFRYTFLIKKMSISNVL